MIKLFSDEAISPDDFSLEQYMRMFDNCEVVSAESLSDYFYKIIDALNTIYNSAISKYTDDDVKDIFSYKLEALHKVKNLNFTTTSENIITVPENFKGKYIDYAKLLHATVSDLYTITVESGNLTKLALADFINNSNLDKLNTLYGHSKVDLHARSAVKLRDTISKYFPYKNAVDKASIRSVLKTYSDVAPIFEYIEKIDKIVNEKTIIEIHSMYSTISDLLNHLIESVSAQNIVIPNTHIKKDLEKMLFNFNKIIETFGYAVYNIKNFYMVVLVDTKTIIQL